MEDELDDAFKALRESTIDLLINVGLIMTLSDKWPEEVQKRFAGKLDTVTGELRREMGEVQDFGQYFDGD